MPVTIDIDTKQLIVPQREVAKWAFRARNMDPAFRVNAKRLIPSMKKRFDRQAAPFRYGASGRRRWAANKPSTVAAKGHAKVLTGGGARRGKLKKSLKAVIGKNRYVIEFVDYGQFHMVGHTRRLFPPRPFAYPSRKQLDRLVKDVTNYIINGASGRGARR